MASSVYFTFQAQLSKDTPKWIIEAIQAMVSKDLTEPAVLEKIMDLTRGGLDKFFKQDRWERLLTQRDCAWPEDDEAPPTRFDPVLDEDGKLIRWGLYGASSVKRNGWDLAYEFGNMIGPWLEPEHNLVDISEGRKCQPFMLAQDDVPFDADRPELTLYYRLGLRALTQHRVRGYIDNFPIPTCWGEAHTWSIKKSTHTTDSGTSKLAANRQGQ